MGAFAEILGMKPWDVDRLTGEQFEAFADYVEKRLRAIEKGAGSE